MAKRFRKRKRNRRRRGSSFAIAKKAAYHVINKTLEKYRLLSFINNAGIGTIQGGNRCLLISLTGGATEGLTLSNQNTTDDPQMKSLFVLQPLGGRTQGNPVDQVSGQGEGGFGSSSVGDGALPATAMLRGNECKLLTYHYKLAVSSPPLDDIANIKPQQFRLMIFETRRPISSELWGAQVFLNAQISTLSAAIGAPPPMTAFPNYSLIKKMYYDKLHQVSTRDFVKEGRIRLNRKAYWKISIDTAANPVSHLQYQGPFIYMLIYGEQDIAQADELHLSMSSLMTFQDA